MFSRSFHQYSWSSEVETTWKSLICWWHRTSNIYSCYCQFFPRTNFKSLFARFNSNFMRRQLSIKFQLLVPCPPIGPKPPTTELWLLFFELFTASIIFWIHLAFICFRPIKWNIDRHIKSNRLCCQNFNLFYVCNFYISNLIC